MIAKLLTSLWNHPTSANSLDKIHIFPKMMILMRDFPNLILRLLSRSFPVPAANTSTKQSPNDNPSVGISLFLCWCILIWSKPLAQCQIKVAFRSPSSPFPLHLHYLPYVCWTLTTSTSILPNDALCVLLTLCSVSSMVVFSSRAFILKMLDSSTYIHTKWCISLRHFYTCI